MKFVVDSNGWIEYFVDGSNAEAFAAALNNPQQLVVPSISVYEVFRWFLRKHGDMAALDIVAQMRQGHVVPLDDTLALSAASIGESEGLAMADAIVLATARAFSATLLTQDADFVGHADVHFCPKSK